MIGAAPAASLDPGDKRRPHHDDHPASSGAPRRPGAGPGRPAGACSRRRVALYTAALAAAWTIARHRPHHPRGAAGRIPGGSHVERGVPATAAAKTMYSRACARVDGRVLYRRSAKMVTAAPTCMSSPGASRQPQDPPAGRGAAASECSPRDRRGGIRQGGRHGTRRSRSPIRPARRASPAFASPRECAPAAARPPCRRGASHLRPRDAPAR
jgi:hypothetical protein